VKIERGPGLNLFCVLCDSSHPRGAAVFYFHFEFFGLFIEVFKYLPVPASFFHQQRT